MATITLTHPEYHYALDVDEEVADLVREIWRTGNHVPSVRRVSGDPGDERWWLEDIKHVFAEELVNAVVEVGEEDVETVVGIFLTACMVMYADPESDELTIQISLSFPVRRLPLVVRAVEAMPPADPPRRTGIRALDLG